MVGQNPKFDTIPILEVVYCLQARAIHQQRMDDDWKEAVTPHPC